MTELARPAAPRYGLGQEVASSVIHGIGIALSIAGLVLLVITAADGGGPRAVAASAVFGASLILLYTVSTLYHAIPQPAVKGALRTFDHIAIFLLIAGTYTPFTLVALHGAWGWGLFASIWTLAALGIALEVGLLKHNRRLAALLYVAMGWVGLVAFGPLSEALSDGGMVLLLAGGAAYTLGVPFYLWRKLPYHHAIWHAFVLAGSVLHFFAVLFYVLPAGVA